MPFDYNPYMERIAQLLSDTAPPSQTDDRGEFLRNCIAAGHRRHFFVEIAGDLSRRGQTLFTSIDRNNLLSKNRMPGKPQWQAFCDGRPMSLTGILKIDAGLTAISQHIDPKINQIAAINGTPFILQPSSVVASIFYCKADSILNFRTELNKSRKAISELVFGKGRYDVWRLLEDESNGGVRITQATLDYMSDTIGDSIINQFTSDYSAGGRRGEDTYALPLSLGNRLRYQKRNRVDAEAAV